MADSLEKETLTAMSDEEKLQAPSETQGAFEAAEQKQEQDDNARLPDLSIGDMETDLPEESGAAEVVEELEIPWGDAPALPLAAEETTAAVAVEGEGETPEESVPPGEIAPAEGAEQVPGPVAPYKRAWYVVHCYSGYENKVKKGLEQRINSMGMQDRIYRVVVPIEKEVEIKEGQRRNIERRVFPGYILVEMMELQQGEPVSDEAWYVVRNTPGVTGFVSSGDKPVPLREEEVTKILQRMESEEPKVHVTFRSGQTVHIIDGPFADFRGTVDNVDMTKGKVRVLVSFFGRETPVELDLLQVEKV
jgi:transcription termination/antitermination protein NusG